MQKESCGGAPWYMLLAALAAAAAAAVARIQMAGLPGSLCGPALRIAPGTTGTYSEIKASSADLAGDESARMMTAPAFDQSKSRD